MLDILIRGGEFPDFKTACMKTGDIGIEAGKIVKIGDIQEEAEMVLEAGGKIVSPGFIDIHMHEENFKDEGYEYRIANMMLKMGVTTCLGGNCGVQYQSIRDFEEAIEKLGGAPVNYMMCTGYNYHRNKMGVDRYGTPTSEQKRQIQESIKREIEAGAYGISFGIEYDPGISTDEILEALEPFNNSYLFLSAHYRGDADEAESSVREMIYIAEKTGMRFQISHLSSCSAMGQMKDVLEIINEAHEKNPKIDYDTYPYAAFSTMIGSAVFDEGCFERWGKDYDCILITEGEHKGKRCDKELFEKLRKDSPNMLVVAFVMNEDEISMAISNKYGMIASDGILSMGQGHPRAAGTFPRVLGKYVREENAISLFEALKKMTFMPAERLELFNKGRIEVGCDADICVFDKDTVLDGATFEDVSVSPKGIEAVIVRGKVAVSNGDIVNGKLGNFIKR